MTTLSTASRVVCAYLGMHEIFCRMGFRPEDLFLHRNPDGECLIVVKQGPRSFNFLLGHDERPHTVVRDEARRIAVAVNEGRVSEEELRTVVVGVRALLGHRDHLLDMIRARGIRVPKPEAYR